MNEAPRQPTQPLDNLDEPPHSSAGSLPTTVSGPNMRQLAGRLRRLVVKELREILRDRRTIITLVVMPILIYPLLAIAFQRFLLTSIQVPEEEQYLIGVESELEGSILLRQLERGGAILEQLQKEEHEENHQPEASSPTLNLRQVSADEAIRHVVDSTLHLVALQRRTPDDDSQKGLHVPMTWELIYRAGSPTSEAALHFVESRLQAYNESQLNEQLQRLGVIAAMPAAMQRRPVRFAGAPVFSLAALIPLILVLMTVTGAVYPAIDLTAGERERGTLETLIAAPVPRFGLLMAKYMAVLTVALLTALVNMAGMTITAHTTGLATSLFGGGLTIGVIGKVLLLLALFAAFFSAILLAITSYARSFKEAQAYIIPLMLVCLVPGVLCLMPGLQFQGWMAVTPLVNIVMLGRDLLEGTAVTGLAVAAVCSTLFYIAAAIAWAARIFGTDAILYGSPATWSDLVRRPPEPQAVASVPAALFGLALMFSAYFVLGTSLARSTELSMTWRMMVIGLITTLVFGGIPMLLTTFGRVRWTSGLGLRGTGIVPLVACVLLGLALWPAAHEVFLLSEWLGLSSLGPQQSEAARAMLAQWEGLPLWLILLSLAVAPGLFEELAFRGFLFGSLSRALAPDRTILVSAVLFGLFHEVLTPGRFLASTFIGLVLGWVRLRTGSILPCMALHMVHNGVLLTIAYHRDELAARGWGMEESYHLPLGTLGAAVVVITLATLLLIATTMPSKTSE